MHALFLATRANRPSHRFRVEQILPFWTAAGHQADVQILARSAFRRMLAYRQWKKYDLVFIQQRTFSAIELFWLRRHVPRLVYDVDDAVMFRPDGRDDRRRWQRFEQMVRASDAIICGNSYLAELCRRWTSSVSVVPTAIDTDRFHPRLRRGSSSDGPVIIGWTGSRATVGYLNAILPAIRRLPKDRVKLKLISDTLDGLDLSLLGAIPHDFVKWTPANEAAETASFDIGLMPVPDSRFTQGKCGCKALQYMALGQPAVVSPVGVNCEIVDHGQNGFLATTVSEWKLALQRLVNDPELRERIGSNGRRTVETRYSLAIQGQRVVDQLEQVRRAA